jgi:hypothetical protein
MPPPFLCVPFFVSGVHQSRRRHHHGVVKERPARTAGDACASGTRDHTRRYRGLHTAGATARFGDRRRSRTQAQLRPVGNKRAESPRGGQRYATGGPNDALLEFLREPPMERP